MGVGSSVSVGVSVGEVAASVEPDPEVAAVHAWRQIALGVAERTAVRARGGQVRGAVHQVEADAVRAVAAVLVLLEAHHQPAVARQRAVIEQTPDVVVPSVEEAPVRQAAFSGTKPGSSTEVPVNGSVNSTEPFEARC